VTSARTATGLVATLSALALFAPLADAVVTSTWVIDSYEQFNQGDATSAFITSLGEVKPGWESKRTEVEGDGIWAALRVGDSVLLGTDAKAALIRVQDDVAKKVVNIDGAIAVVALARGGGNIVYAGTMPGAKVMKIDLASSKATALVSLPDTETIWALAASADGKTLYAGTGPKGLLYSIDVAKGTAKKVFDTEDKRITALVATSDGAIWLGTSERALVFRYDPKSGTTRAMADFAGNEVSSLAALDDGVVVAANDFAEPPMTGPRTASSVAEAKKPGKDGESAKMPDVDSKPGADRDASALAEVPRRGARKGKGAVFHVHGDGRLVQLHALTATWVTSVVTTETGAVYAGAGDKGRVYLIDTDESVSTAFDVDERLVSQLTYDAKAGLAFSTDDAAAFYRASGRASAAKYMSDVMDAKSPSKFGKVAWQGAGKLGVETRTGNTAKPGPGWSEWAEPTAISKSGSVGQSGKIASPPGRYFQFRVSFDAADASLTKVSTFYLPQNTATQLTDVTIEPTSGTGGTMKDGAAKPRSPIVRVKWRVENPDGDDTTFVLSVRREGEALWRPITPPKAPVTGTSYEWNSESFPDGYYRLRAVASDAVANSPDRALESQKTTPVFALDNERPTIEGLAVSYPKASARASDALSNIVEMAFSVDDGPWQLGAAQDGLFDDLSEALRIDLPADLAAGMHTLTVRVADDVGNVGSASTSFKIK
jgi:hypothetical protein